MPALLDLPLGLTLHGLITVAALLIYVLSSHLMHQRRAPSAAIAWILFILLLPYVALPAYLSFGSRKLARPGLPAPRVSSRMRGRQAWAVESLLALGQAPPVRYTALHVHQDGLQAQGALFGAIEAADTSIDLCTFLLGRDELGRAVIDALSRKAAQGVRVRLLIDGMGRLMTRPPDLARLEAAGGECALFVPPLSSPLKGRTNLRNHRKLLVTDPDTDRGRLWCGGRNLTAQYFEGLPDQTPWTDLSFDLRGPLTGQARDLFEQDWAFATGPPFTPKTSGAQSPVQPLERAGPLGGAQLVASGPDQSDDTVYTLLVMAAYRARTRIALATPYFVPETALLMALCMAARRGVQVDLLLPARSNHRLSDLARARSLRSLAQAGAQVWLAPTMMHAKLVVIDDVLALAGSANLDTRSLFLNYEVMCAFHTAADVRRFSDWFDRERRTASLFVARAPGLMRDVAEGMLLWLGFQL